jgi:GNAT superfamily N-acetyltransferase
MTEWHPRVHSRAEEIHFASRMIALGWVRVARLDGAVIGFLARDRHDIVALYIHSGAQRQGVGKTLMLDAKQSKAHLTAWSYAKNIQAQNFYQSEGFTEDHRTDGCQNDLKLPDIKYTWNHNT